MSYDLAKLPIQSLLWVSGADWVAVRENKPIRGHLVVCRSADWHGGVDDQQESGAEQMPCADLDIEHRLTKPRHPWTNGQVERMNRTIKDATVKRFHYDDHDQLSRHMTDFIDAYNFGRRLKTLPGLTPYEFICKIWTKEPKRFTINPIHQMPGLNI
jgi:hypothetical protein